MACYGQNGVWACLPEGARRGLGQEGIAVEHNREHKGEHAEVRHKQRHEKEVADDALLVIPPPADAQQCSPVKRPPSTSVPSLGPPAVLLSIIPQLQTQPDSSQPAAELA